MENFFISIEGIEGAGKTTCWRKLKELFELSRISSTFVREPGGTPLGEMVREILLKNDLTISPEAELFLYASARAQLVSTIIKPCLEKGEWVISDRYFDATVAYQGYGRRLNLNFVKEIALASTLHIIPSLTIIIDISPHTGFKRIDYRENDRLEKEGVEFMKRVRDGYLKIAEEEKKRCVIIDGERPFDAVFEEIRGIIERRFNISLKGE